MTTKISASDWWWIFRNSAHYADAGSLRRRKLIMIVDESGRLKNLPENMLGCVLYGTYNHGNPIVGDLIFARIRGEDIVGLDDAEKLKQYILQLFVGLKEE